MNLVICAGHVSTVKKKKKMLFPSNSATVVVTGLDIRVKNQLRKNTDLILSIWSQILIWHRLAGLHIEQSGSLCKWAINGLCFICEAWGILNLTATE